MKKLYFAFGLAAVLPAIGLGQTAFQITSPPTLPNGRVGLQYSYQLQATGGSQPYNWSLVFQSNYGGLPPGLSLSSSGLISGTPNKDGTYAFQIQVTAGTSIEPPTRYQVFTITVNNPPPVTILTNSPLPAGTVGSVYSTSFTASGGYSPYTWSMPPGATLPPGLNLSASTGLLQGTPTTAGTYNFTVIAADRDNVSTSKSFSLSINTGLTITTTTLPNGTVGQQYLAALAATGGTTPYSWSLEGTLPAGLSLNTSTGAITGTPTTQGTVSFTAVVVDSADHIARRSLSIPVSAAATLNITTTTLPNGTVGQSYTASLAASGGTTPYFWSLAQGTLPAGLTLSTAGAITGTPTTAGTNTFAIRVTDAQQSFTSREFTVTISRPTGPLVIVTDALPRATTGELYSFTLTGSGGTQPYQWSIVGGSLPSGITLSGATGQLTGIPEQTGVSSVVIRLIDGRSAPAERTFTLEVTAPQQNLRFSTDTLLFEAIQGGDTPAAQYLSVVSGSQIRDFTLTTDGGTTGSAAPAWLRVSTLRGSTPARIGVAVDPTGLIPGVYRARITTFDADQLLATTIQLTVVARGPELEVAPSIISFAGTPQALLASEQAIVVRNNGGGGALNVAVRVPANAPWLTVTPASGVAAPNAPFVAKLRVNPGTLSASAYMTQLQVQTGVATTQATVSMLIRSSGPSIGLDFSSIRFAVRDGQGAPPAQTVNVLNTGDGSLSWNATVVNTRWLSISPAAGVSTAQVGTPVAISVSPAGLARGVYQGLIRITSSQAPNSPQYLLVLLQVLDANLRPEPEFSPAGVVFSAIPGTTPATERVRLSVSSASVAFQATPATRDGAAWLVVSPTTGNVSTDQQINLNVSVVPTGLAPGVYRGEVAVALGGLPVRAINVTLIVPRVAGASQARAASSGDRELTGCTPDRLVLTHTALPGSFSVPAAAPVPLAVVVRDNCQDPVGDASVVVRFSNGDPALPLRVSNRQRGIYSGVWIPGVVRDAVTVRAEATSPTLSSGNAEVAGGTAARVPVPILSPGGIVSAFNPIGGGLLAPGSVIELYGTDLASGTAQPTTLPLPTVFNGVTVLVGDREAPLFYTSSGQTNIQVPYEAEPGREYALLYNANGALAVSTLTLSPVQPALLSYAQRTNGTFVSPDAPAAPGEVLLLYLVGMGETNPPVASGAGSPGVEPFGRVASDVAVTIGDRPAELFFEGLTPAFVGLYQINLRVPADLETGTYDVVVTQEGRSSNVFRMPVRR